MKHAHKEISTVPPTIKLGLKKGKLFFLKCMFNSPQVENLLPNLRAIPTDAQSNTYWVAILFKILFICLFERERM